VVIAAAIYAQKVNWAYRHLPCTLSGDNRECLALKRHRNSTHRFHCLQCFWATTTTLINYQSINLSIELNL